MALEPISRDVIVATIVAACGPAHDQAPDRVLVRALARYCVTEGKALDEVIAHLREAFSAYYENES